MVQWSRTLSRWSKQTRSSGNARVSSCALQVPVAQVPLFWLFCNTTACDGFKHFHLHVCPVHHRLPTICLSMAQERLWSIIPFLPDGLAETSELQKTRDKKHNQVWAILKDLAICYNMTNMTCICVYTHIYIYIYTHYIHIIVCIYIYIVYYIHTWYVCICIIHMYIVDIVFQ